MSRLKLLVPLAVLCLAVSAAGCALGDMFSSDSFEQVALFSGQVKGSLVAHSDNNTVMFQVSEVVNVWPESQARKPKALKGRVVQLAAREVTTKREAGVIEVERDPDQTAFLRKLEPGQDWTLQVRNGDDKRSPLNFIILQLTKEQVDFAKGTVKAPAPPKTEKPEKPEKTDKPEKTEKPDKAEKPEAPKPAPKKPEGETP